MSLVVSREELYSFAGLAAVMTFTGRWLGCWQPDYSLAIVRMNAMPPPRVYATRERCDFVCIEAGHRICHPRQLEKQKAQTEVWALNLVAMSGLEPLTPAL